MTIEEALAFIAPEFNSVEPARIATAIELAECQVSESIFKCDYALAAANLTAHMLSLAGRNTNEGANGQAGNVTQKKEGDLQLNYALLGTISSGDGVLATTAYGIEFIRLRNMHVITVRTFYAD